MPALAFALPFHSRLRRWLRILLWTASVLLALVLVVALVALLWLRSTAQFALPVLDGDLHVAGLSSPVTVLRDGHGVPHIQAASQQDLFQAQGYVRARPPMADGRLPPQRQWRSGGDSRPLAGTPRPRSAGLPVSFDRPAHLCQPAADDRARLDDYARGVNAFIDEHPNSLPRVQAAALSPQPWSGADSVSIGLMMVEMLDSHFDVKLSRERIAAKLHNSKLEFDLYPVGSWRDHPPTGVRLDLSQPHPSLLRPRMKTRTMIAPRLRLSRKDPARVGGFKR